MNPVKIAPSLIPAADMRVLCATFAEAAKRFYENPVNQRRFEKWKAQKNKEDKIS